MLHEVTINLNNYHIDFFYYRVRGGKLIRKIVLEGVDSVYTLYDDTVNQLVKQLGLKYRDIINMDWQERNKLLNTARLGKEVLLLLNRDKVVRVTSTRYQYIPHNLILSTIDDTLSAMGLDYKREVNYEHGLRAWYNLKAEDEFVDREWNRCIYVYNHNVGDRALRISSGLLIQKCQNGLVDWAFSSALRLVHVQDKDVVRAKIKLAVTKEIERFGEISMLAHNSNFKIVGHTSVEKYVKKMPFPNHVKYQIRRQIPKGDVTLWELLMALTWTSTHYAHLTPSYRFELEKEASRVLHHGVERILQVGGD